MLLSITHCTAARTVQVLGGLPFGSCANGTAPECRANAWGELSKLRTKGVVRDIGVSNFGISQIEELRNLKCAARNSWLERHAGRP